MSDEEVLEGFFAKKDKTKKPKKKKKTKTSETIVTESEGGQIKQVDEWKDFEEEKEKDYSNLKIADLQVGDDNEKEEQEDQKNDNEVDGVNNDDEAAGIWKTSNPQAAAASTHKAPAKDLPGSHNVVGGKYVPPSMKRAAASQTSAPRRRQGAPPDIQSKAAFPSLSAASQDTNSKMPADFELVKRGTRATEARVDDRPKLETGNRYQGLKS